VRIIVWPCKDIIGDDEFIVGHSYVLVVLPDIRGLLAQYEVYNPANDVIVIHG